MIKSGTLREGLPSGVLPGESFDTLIEQDNVRIERIVSTGQVTPDGDWLDSEDAEFVLVVSGAAKLRIEGEWDDRALGEGDYILLLSPSRHFHPGLAADDLARGAFPRPRLSYAPISPRKPGHP
jgi:cupin 2 domain-containing protein